MASLDGLWGVFVLKSNMHYYNPSNAKLGTMFIHHNEISRDHIKVYNVRVVVVPSPPHVPGVKPVTLLRIHATALAALAKVCPEFPMPRSFTGSRARLGHLWIVRGQGVEQEGWW